MGIIEKLRDRLVYDVLEVEREAKAKGWSSGVGLSKLLIFHLRESHEL